MASVDSSRVIQARDTATALLDELELNQGAIMNSLLKAKRLARLMRDADAQTWLDIETTGYPSSFTFSILGTCESYARKGGRISADDKYYLASLPKIEADIESDRVALSNLKFPSNIAPSLSSSNPNELTGAWMKGALTEMTTTFNQTVTNTKARISNNVALSNGLKSALHSYATDCFHALTFGDVAETLFEQARSRVDTFVRARAPKAADQLASAYQRFKDDDPEALTHALTSCRRLIQTMADGLFPPQSAPYVDSGGQSRKVGTEEYKNRLLAYIDQKLASGSTRAILHAEVESIADRVDALYEKACKGVHADVTSSEVRLVLIAVYLLLSELVELSE